MKNILFGIVFLFTIFSSAQIRLVNDFNTGVYGSSFPSSFFEYNGRLFFTADLQGNSVRNIFVTDGTTNGIKPINFDNTNTGPLALSYYLSGANFYEYNSELFFESSKTRLGDVHVAKLTGTSNVATSVMNISAISGISGPSSRFASAAGLDNKLVFSPVSAGNGNNIEPYVIDFSTPANNGLLLNVNTVGSSEPKDFTVFGNAAYFSAKSATAGIELWKTNGTSTGTQLYLDINTGSANSNPNQFLQIGNELAFVATSPIYGTELFKTDGNGSFQLVKDINTSSNAASSNPTKITKIGNLLYFSADNGYGFEPWISDGTTQGTFLLKDILPFSAAVYIPYGFTAVGSTVYFFTSDGNYTYLYKTNGTAEGTVLVKQFSDSYSCTNPIAYNNLLYFIVKSNISQITSLWVSDGTSIDTDQILGIYPEAMCLYNNELYMAATLNTGTLGQELYAYRDPTLEPSTNQAPVASFSASSYSINKGNSVNFYDNSTNTPTSWAWTFSGGVPATSTSTNPTNIKYDAVGCYPVTLKVTNASGTNTKSQTCYINVTEVSTSSCNELFFSEYLEGTSNSKALEIFNPSNNAIDLSSYSVELYANGGTNATSIQILSGSIAAYGTYVLANSGAVAGILSVANLNSSACSFNGDDAIVLKKGSTIIDVIGEVGIDPGTTWTVGTGSTLDYTLVRNATIDKPSNSWATVQNQWTVNPVNTITNLGQHSSNCNNLATDNFDANFDNTISIFPNPTTTEINLRSNSRFGISKIILTDLNGRIVKQNKFDNLTNVQLNIGNLSKGIYLMKIISREGTITKKIIKN